MKVSSLVGIVAHVTVSTAILSAQLSFESEWVGLLWVLQWPLGYAFAAQFGPHTWRRRAGKPPRGGTHGGTEAQEDRPKPVVPPTKGVHWHRVYHHRDPNPPMPVDPTRAAELAAKFYDQDLGEAWPAQAPGAADAKFPARAPRKRPDSSR